MVGVDVIRLADERWRAEQRRPGGEARVAALSRAALMRTAADALRRAEGCERAWVKSFDLDVHPEAAQAFRDEQHSEAAAAMIDVKLALELLVAQSAPRHPFCGAA